MCGLETLIALNLVLVISSTRRIIVWDTVVDPPRPPPEKHPEPNRRLRLTRQVFQPASDLDSFLLGTRRLNLPPKQPRGWNLRHEQRRRKTKKKQLSIQQHTCLLGSLERRTLCPPDFESFVDAGNMMLEVAKMERRTGRPGDAVYISEGPRCRNRISLLRMRKKVYGCKITRGDFSPTWQYRSPAMAQCVFTLKGNRPINQTKSWLAADVWEPRLWGGRTMRQSKTRES